MQTIVKLLGNAVKLLGGYIPPIPPFRVSAPLVCRLAARRGNCPNGTQKNSNKVQHVSYKFKKT